MVRLLIAEERCKGCGLCVAVCPRKILQLSGGRLNRKGYHPVEVVKEGCTACAACAKICPDIVFTVEKQPDSKPEWEGA